MQDNHRATYNMPLRTGGGDTYQLLNHGDLWVNNIMFKYGDDDGNKHPIDIRFVRLLGLSGVYPICAITSNSTFRLTTRFPSTHLRATI